MPSDTNFEIIAGTYEEYLLGYICTPEEHTLAHSFASHDHSSSVRCLATCGNYLASGASDDRIIIYDLKTRKEHCMLTHHQGTISAVAFTNNHSHIISASQDGTLAIVRVGNWQLEKVWEKAHKGGYVIDIALHSSGKLALTLGTDATIRTWNLVKGRAAYIINLNNKCKDPKSIERIIFAPDDTRFLLVGGKYTEIWSIEVGGVLQVIEHDQKVTCCNWLDNSTLSVGYEDGKLGTVDLETDKKKVVQAHNGRVKAVQHFQNFIVTASSTGQIKVWTKKLKEVSTVDTGCRITCVCLAKLIGNIKKEEPEEEATVKQAVVRKTVKRSVIVEVEESSEDDSEKIIEKKKQKKERHIDADVTQETKKAKKKKNKKKLANKHTLNDSSEMRLRTTDTEGEGDKIVQNKHEKEVNKTIKGQSKSKEKLKKKKKTLI